MRRAAYRRTLAEVRAMRDARDKDIEPLLEYPPLVPPKRKRDREAWERKHQAFKAQVEKLPGVIPMPYDPRRIAVEYALIEVRNAKALLAEARKGTCDAKYALAVTRFALRQYRAALKAVR